MLGAVKLCFLSQRALGSPIFTSRACSEQDTIAQPWTSSPKGDFPPSEHFLHCACAPSPPLGSILPPQPAPCLQLCLGEENFPVLLLPHAGWPGIWILSHTSSAAQRCVGEQYIPFIGRATGQRKERSKPPPFSSPGVCWFPFFSPPDTHRQQQPSLSPCRNFAQPSQRGPSRGQRRSPAALGRAVGLRVAVLPCTEDGWITLLLLQPDLHHPRTEIQVFVPSARAVKLLPESRELWLLFPGP